MLPALEHLPTWELRTNKLSRILQAKHRPARATAVPTMASAATDAGEGLGVTLDELGRLSDPAVQSILVKMLEQVSMGVIMHVATHLEANRAVPDCPHYERACDDVC